MLARYDAQNSQALEKLLKTGIQVSAYSQEILEAAEKASFALYYDQFAAKDADFKAVYE
jgi:TRAP-type mannitol/chloroaromatic compound transport system substrate-binding protein